MALLIQETSMTEIEPKNGVSFTLWELGDYLGGRVICSQTTNKKVMAWSAGAEIAGRYENVVATSIVGWTIYGDVVLGDAAEMECEVKPSDAE